MVRKAESTALDSGLVECLANMLFMMVERSTINRATSCRERHEEQVSDDLWQHQNLISNKWCDYQCKVIMRGLLLHWCMLGKVDEIGTDRLWVGLHVNGLRGSRQTRLILLSLTPPLPLLQVKHSSLLESDADLLQSSGRHAPHAVKQGEFWEVLQQPLVTWQQLGICRIFLHGLFPLISILQASFGQHQRQTLHTNILSQMA